MKEYIQTCLDSIKNKQIGIKNQREIIEQLENDIEDIYWDIIFKKHSLKRGNVIRVKVNGESVITGILAESFIVTETSSNVKIIPIRKSDNQIGSGYRYADLNNIISTYDSYDKFLEEVNG